MYIFQLTICNLQKQSALFYIHHSTLIHCLDPVFISQKIAFTSVDRFVSIEEILENTITGIKGIGGFQTRGKYRKGLPKSPYQ
ncbi:sporulation peptidase YabG [Paramaledivibacter caminithermalis]|jgi:spore coat assembly protein|uniref:sporulation peptidase YabG n=1 Tax=Paramaledivibacter caminithermalis TaxID=191027 RepID=UPI000A03F4CE|nr:sporulation peptidase YabG [Paramaledivibacter caminithermalis]